MNLAQTHSEGYEYRALAMPRFDAMLLGFAAKPKRVYASRRVPAKTQPSLKLDWQRSMWAAMASLRPMLLVEIYDDIPESFSATRAKRQRIRMILLSWYRANWIRRTGLERHYLYARVK